jgi:hypothetical protein
MSGCLHSVSLAVERVELTRDWWSLGIQLGLAIATLLAVAAALWGEGWRRQHRRPRLSPATTKDWLTDTIYLTLTNDPRKETARDVEIQVNYVQQLQSRIPPSPSAYRAVRADLHSPLQWSEALGEGLRTDVPPGATRRAPLIYYAADEGVMPDSDSTMEVMSTPTPFPIHDFWHGFQDMTREPARINVTIAGSNVPSRDYEILVSYYPVQTGYNAKIEMFFDLRMRHAPRSRDLRFRRWRRWVQNWVWTWWRMRPLPSRSDVQRHRDRKRRVGRQLPNKSAISRVRERRSDPNER